MLTSGNFYDRNGIVNTPPALKCGSFWTNPSSEEFGAQGPVPTPFQDGDRGVVVPIEGHTAITRDPAIREREMREKNTATRAGLGRVGGIYQDDLATSVFSFVRETGDQVGPTGIQDAHGEDELDVISTKTSTG